MAGDEGFFSEPTATVSENALQCTLERDCKSLPALAVVVSNLRLALTTLAH